MKLYMHPGLVALIIVLAVAYYAVVYAFYYLSLVLPIIIFGSNFYLLKKFEPKYIWISGFISLFAYSTTFLSLVFAKDIYGPWILTSSFDYRDEKLLEYILFSGAISIAASFLYYNSFKNLEPEKK